MRALLKKIRPEQVFLLALALVYLGALCLINLSGRPSFYNTDMYMDISFAAEAVAHGSLFPEGWIFGNQLYLVATPALAALFGMITENPVLMMSLAAIVMGIGVAVSFLWMLKPVLPDFWDRLFGLLFFMSLMLYYGDSIGTENGWQLLFTMCAYYACYAIGAFLAFGCCLRSDAPLSRGTMGILALACGFSFGTGMQSLRQTAVMTLPMLAVAFLEVLMSLRKNQPWLPRRVKMTGLISGCNLLGVVAQKLVDVPMNEIFGEMSITKPGELLLGLRESFQTMVSLLSSEDVHTCTVLIVVIVGALAALAELIRYCKKSGDGKPLSLLLLLVLAVLGILAIDTLTTMEVRRIYYFMAYPLLAFLAAFLYSRRKQWGKYAVLAVLTVVMIAPSVRALADVCMQAYFAKYDQSYAISEYLEGQGYTTIYSGWNHGEDVAVASKGRLKAGFWDKKMYEPIEYLCNPKLYAADSVSCAYLFGSGNVDIAMELARTKGVEMTVVAHNPDSDTYILTAPVNLMLLFAEDAE